MNSDFQKYLVKSFFESLENIKAMKEQNNTPLFYRPLEDLFPKEVEKSNPFLPRFLTNENPLFPVDTSNMRECDYLSHLWGKPFSRTDFDIYDRDEGNFFRETEGERLSRLWGRDFGRTDSDIWNS